MSDLLEVNKQEVVNEIQHLFETYETALINKDVEVLDNTFKLSPVKMKTKSVPIVSNKGETQNLGLV